VLGACGVELEAGLAFGVVRQCLEPAVRTADDAERTRLFSGAAALAESLLVDLVGAGPEASFGALHGLYWLLANLCESGPLLIAVDDAHWADDASLRFFSYLGALIDLGSALRRAGRRTDAREPLRAGYELARECGAHGVAETARLELAASGVRLRRERLTGAASLTASELRIADLAAAGASDAEIAQALFVTVKTVEMHLTHAYRKLDITRRAALPAALADADTHLPNRQLPGSLHAGSSISR
jgi:DNA-binding CsgD family transcriptional regulator